MRVEKRVLNDALRVLGKVVCQTSPVELYRSVRFVGDENGIQAMATDGVETVSVAVDAFTESEIDFCVPFKELKYLTPDDEHIMGIEYYQAVIADGVRTRTEFNVWRQAHPADGIVIWCP